MLKPAQRSIPIGDGGGLESGGRQRVDEHVAADGVIVDYEDWAHRELANPQRVEDVAD
jgi:hypothetical protein